MIRCKLLFAVAVALFAAGPALSAQTKSPYVGVWKLDTISPALGN